MSQTKEILSMEPSGILFVVIQAPVLATVV